MRTTLSFAGLALVAVVACGTSSEGPPPGVTPSGGKSGAGSGGAAGRGSGGAAGSHGGEATGGTGDMAGASGAEDGGAPTAGSGQGGVSGEGGASTGGSAGIAIAGRGEEPEPCMEAQEEPPASGVCEPGANWGAGEPVAVMADAGDPFVAVTPDERTLLFLHVTSVGEAMIADRADASDDFGTPVPVGIDGVVGMSPDGLRVIVRAFDGTLEEATRSAPGEEFGTPAEGAFTLVNAAAAADGASITAPVIAPDDRTLYYLAVPPSGTEYPLHVSTRAGAGAWPVGTAVEACELRAFQGFNPTPTGVSSDGLTLFFWDSFYGVARAAFREDADGPFVWFEELGPIVAAQVNTGCNRLYYSDDGILYASSE
jgi:hypothetical protein